MARFVPSYLLLDHYTDAGKAFFEEIYSHFYDSE